MGPLEEMTKKRFSDIVQKDLDVLFKDLYGLFHLHNLFYAELKNGYSSSANNSKFVAQVFEKYLQFFKIYSEYVGNYKDKLAKLGKIIKTYQFKKFEDAYYRMTRNPENISKEYDRLLLSQPIESFLIMPVQRLPRYSLLLKQLLKSTPIA